MHQVSQRWDFPSHCPTSKFIGQLMNIDQPFILNLKETESSTFFTSIVTNFRIQHRYQFQTKQGVRPTSLTHVFAPHLMGLFYSASNIPLATYPIKYPKHSQFCQRIGHCTIPFVVALDELFLSATFNTVP